MGRKGKKTKNTKRTEKTSASSSPGSKYHGLENQGATCYLNSVLQVLFMTNDFRVAVSSSANSDPECIDKHLSTLFNTLLNKTAKTQAITDHLKISRVSEQADAAECLEKILSCSSPRALQIFQGLLTHRNTCSKCHITTSDDQPFWSLPVPLLDSDKDYRVMDGLKRFFEKSNISGENQMYCNQCKAKADASVNAEIQQYPQVLTLLMKRFRFDYSDMKYVKMTNTVEIPSILSIPPNGSQSQEYELYACVQHSGDLKHGHYTVNIKPQDDETWYSFDDTRVTPISQANCKKSSYRSANAYLLFYRKSSAAHTFSQDIADVSFSEGPKTGNKDKNERHEKDVKAGKRKGDEEAEAADSQTTDCSSDKSKRKRNFTRGKDSKTVTDGNGGTSVSQKSRDGVENQQSKENNDVESKKDISDKLICNPACSSEEQNGGDESKKAEDQEIIVEQSESRCSETEVDQDSKILAEVCQDVSEVFTSAPKHQTQDKNKHHNQDVKTVGRSENEEAEAADSHKTDKINSETNRNITVNREKDGRTMTDNSCISVNHESGKKSPKNQCQSNIAKVQNDASLQERNSQNSRPDRRRRTSSQIYSKHQVSDRRDSREAVEYQQSKQNDDLESKRDICDKSVSNPPACSSEKLNEDEEECKKADDKELMREESDSCRSDSKVDQEGVNQNISEVSAFKNFCLNNGEKREEKCNEKKVMNVSEDQDRGTCVEIQGNGETMLINQSRGSQESRVKISLCNDQSQKKEEDSVSINTSVNNQEHRVIISNSVTVHDRHECCDETEGNQENGKLEVVQGQEVKTQVVKETKDVKCDARTHKIDTMSGCSKNSSQRDLSESKRYGNACMTGKAENNAERKSLSQSGAENTEKVSPGTQMEADGDKLHESNKKGRKKKRQNKQNNSILYVGLPSPRMKNTNQS